jgi:hypothetical protein
MTGEKFDISVANRKAAYENAPEDVKQALNAKRRARQAETGVDLDAVGSIFGD